MATGVVSVKNNQIYGWLTNEILVDRAEEIVRDDLVLSS